MIARFVFAAMAVVFSPFSTHALNPTVPMLLNYQGQLKNAGSVPQTGTFSMTFKFYDAESGGNHLPNTAPWTETQSVTVTEGVFNVLLGSVTDIPDSLFDGGPTDSKGPLRFLEVTVEGETLIPRKRVGSAAYSLTGVLQANMPTCDAGKALTWDGAQFSCIIPSCKPPRCDVYSIGTSPKTGDARCAESGKNCLIRLFNADHLSCEFVGAGGQAVCCDP